ncbi:RES family NAD+ phosphorylase [Luteitalea pratensis]|uniref:RES family NAD+ phosphorylase n=1 Tax=Luteitalea pratensis TaxID=1855912 RepID=UPI000D73EE15|nr:RES domain-containing protein [Luteitalea pratensis]
MIAAWRIIKARHVSSAFSGEGARLAGGRWNSKGIAVAYTAGSQSLATLEMLVHLGAGAALQSYVLIRSDFDEALVTEVDATALPSSWRSFPAPAALAAIGDAWVSSVTSAVLRVPSVIVPSEANYLFNPQHSQFNAIQVGTPTTFSFDPRFVLP